MYNDDDHGFVYTMEWPCKCPLHSLGYMQGFVEYLCHFFFISKGSFQLS